LPITVFAVSTLKELIDDTFIPMLQSLVILIIGLALLYFLWGLAVFVLKSGDEKGREEGKQKMLWGIIVLFVMASFGGIIKILQMTLFGSTTGLIPPFLGG
jgi:hypothetical protein